MMHPVKNIIFDLGGVLLNLDLAGSRQAFHNLGVSEIEELFRAGHSDSFFRRYETGHLNDEEFITMARTRAMAGTGDHDILNAWNSMLRDFPSQNVAFLDQLKNRYRLFLFSNTNSLHLQSFQKSFREVYGRELDSLFEKAWYSHVINLRKPDVEAFRFVVEDARLEAAETLFIDDTLPNVEGARAAGLQARHLEPGKTIMDLGL
jgi:HAD superfamily hydrolase (TIGR01509 family)